VDVKSPSTHTTRAPSGSDAATTAAIADTCEPMATRSTSTAVSAANRARAAPTASS
jgi:hypothetical protein